MKKNNSIRKQASILCNWPAGRALIESNRTRIGLIAFAHCVEGFTQTARVCCGVSLDAQIHFTN